MKAITILSSTPDIVFFTADEEFLDQLDRFAAEQGMEKVGVVFITPGATPKGPGHKASP